MNVLDGLLGEFVDDKTPSVMVFVDVSLHELVGQLICMD